VKENTAFGGMTGKGAKDCTAFKIVIIYKNVIK
jgi:hypothetical protein